MAYAKAVSTHSRPKAAGQVLLPQALEVPVFQLTAARRRLECFFGKSVHFRKFQLTAARRRLDAYDIVKGALESVSTHSRPKAAGHRLLF